MTTINTIRHCKDIGMFALDRPESSCKWATSYCAKYCYNRKLYAAFGHAMRPKDKLNEEAWQTITGEAVAETLNRKRKDTSRFRLMTRGEAFETVNDISRVRSIITANPDRLVWLPTRAWRGHLRSLIEQHIMPLPNVRLMASIDPSNTPEEIADLTTSGWSTMFFGDDNATEGRFLCPKTHDHQNGHCLTCENGCFSADQVHVHLKSH